MDDFTSQFANAMRLHGFEPKGRLIADDRWHPAYYMDEKRKCSGTYTIKLCDNNFAIGCYFSRKDPDTKFNWHSKSDEPINPERLKEINRKIEAERERKQAEDERRQENISRRLTKYCKSLRKTVDHPYLTNKQITCKARFRQKTKELIIPLYRVDGKIWSIQKINTKGGKYLFAGGKKQGSYYPFCSGKDDFSIVVICEGFATGATIREATKFPVIVAVDSGNLTAVTVEMKAKFAGSKILICADNDAFTKKPNGESWNVGVDSAKKAAHSIGGAHVITPDFSKIPLEIYNKYQPTDFNDLNALSSIAEVKEQILDVVNNIYTDDQPAIEVPPEKEEKTLGDFDMNFRVLGVNNGIYYYYPFKGRQIVALTACAHNSMPNLFRLDNLFSWEDKFGGGKVTESGEMQKSSHSKIAIYAANALMDMAETRGVFKEEDRIRGCGAWIDKGRKILHCGDKLYVDNVLTKFEDLSSYYTYVAAANLLKPATSPLGNPEAYALRKICESVTWENSLSGSLLAGWLVIAPICGALSFRPHIYITGEVESGKSTVLEKIIQPVLGRASLNVDGGTTEPAIRQSMAYDARPLVYDEAEKSDEMPKVLDLVRKASTGGQVLKFGQGLSKVRFCACFSAVNPPVSKISDQSRMSFMNIKKNQKPTAIADYDKLLDLIHKTITPEFADRLLARTLENMDAILKNAAIFERVARPIVKSPRAAQLIGTMVAGTYSLSKTGVVTEQLAREWIEQHDWRNHTSINEEADPAKLLQYISSCILRLEDGDRMKEYSIGDLIHKAHESEMHNSNQCLRYYGIAVKDDRVHFAGKSQHLEKLLKNTDWSINWTRTLAHINGAEKFHMFYFGVGYKTSGVSLPMELFTKEAHTYV